MLVKVFSLNVATSANQFQEQIENAADIVIQRLEERIRHLENILEVADAKIISLDQKITMAEKVLGKEIKDILPSENIVNSANAKIQEHVKIPTTNVDEITVPIKKNNTIGMDNYKEIARNNKRNSVLALADQGYSSVEIAKTTGISKSEIILLLQLNKK
ncbi:MAG: hypothetical protein K0R78_3029 [Pelosinus sp.]|jgi:hypothetical protein|nr:hypothetical protein [Pelosinus sp.]